MCIIMTVLNSSHNSILNTQYSIQFNAISFTIKTKTFSLFIYNTHNLYKLISTSYKCMYKEIYTVKSLESTVFSFDKSLFCFFIVILRSIAELELELQLAFTCTDIFLICSKYSKQSAYVQI